MSVLREDWENSQGAGESPQAKPQRETALEMASSQEEWELSIPALGLRGGPFRSGSMTVLTTDMFARI